MIIFGIFTGLKITTNIVPLFEKTIAWKILNFREKKSQENSASKKQTQKQ